MWFAIISCTVKLLLMWVYEWLSGITPTAHCGNSAGTMSQRYRAKGQRSSVMPGIGHAWIVEEKQDLKEKEKLVHRKSFQPTEVKILQVEGSIFSISNLKT